MVIVAVLLPDAIFIVALRLVVVAFFAARIFNCVLLAFDALSQEAETEPIFQLPLEVTDKLLLPPSALKYALVGDTLSTCWGAKGDCA